MSRVVDPHQMAAVSLHLPRLRPPPSQQSRTSSHSLHTDCLRCFFHPFSAQTNPKKFSLVVLR